MCAGVCGANGKFWRMIMKYLVKELQTNLTLTDVGRPARINRLINGAGTK